MTYIENVFLCLAIPLILSLFFTEGRGRRFTLFMTLGMGICLLSAYVSSFFMVYYGTSATVTAIEITPVCEEVMKLLPLLFFFLIFEPEAKELPGVAISIAVGFATFENVCCLVENLPAHPWHLRRCAAYPVRHFYRFCDLLSVPPPLAGADRHGGRPRCLCRLPRHL